MKSRMSCATALGVCIACLLSIGHMFLAQPSEGASGRYVDQDAIPQAIKGFDEDKVKQDPICDSSHRPKITSVEPDEVHPGDTITVTGEYFGRKKECLYKIVIGDVEGRNLTYIDEHTLTVTVPESASPGLRFLNVQTGGGSARSAILIKTDK